jgi:hypothetical protein
VPYDDSTNESDDEGHRPNRAVLRLAPSRVTAVDPDAWEHLDRVPQVRRDDEA